MFDDVLDNTHFRKSSICSFMLTAASINWCVTHEYTDLVIGQINPTVRRRMAAYRHSMGPTSIKFSKSGASATTTVAAMVAKVGGVFGL